MKIPKEHNHQTFKLGYKIALDEIEHATLEIQCKMMDSCEVRDSILDFIQELKDKVNKK
jgi:hypothetical protein